MQKYEAGVLIRKIRDRIIEPMGVLENRVFALVCEGVVNSRFTPTDLGNYYRDQVSPGPNNN
jgi:hypothetical protein